MWQPALNQGLNNNLDSSSLAGPASAEHLAKASAALSSGINVKEEFNTGTGSATNNQVRPPTLFPSAV